MRGNARGQRKPEKGGFGMGILTQKQPLTPGSQSNNDHIINRLFAQDCLLCASPSDAGILCAACANELPHLDPPHCPQCGLPTPNGERCGRCISHPPHYDVARALFIYDFPLDKLIQAFKYGHKLALGPYFGRQLAALASGIAADLIVPLPLHPERLRERGFNQALELARPVAAALQRPLDTHCCQRIRPTPAQASLPWRERAKNIRNAFHCSADLSGKHVLLIDDVMTTGASLDECARTLKLHGAATVTLLVVAWALPKS